MSDSYLAAVNARSADKPTGGSASGGDINYADELKKYLTGALNDVLAKQPSDPFRAMQQVLFQASLNGAGPLTAVTPVTPEVNAYEAKYALYVSVDDCLFKMKTAGLCLKTYMSADGDELVCEIGMPQR